MLGDGIPSSPLGYRSFFFSILVPRQGHHGGTAVLIRSDVPFTQEQLQSNLQAVAATVFLGRFYTLCSLYLPSGDPINRPHLDALVHGLSLTFLILGDFNGRHSLWDDSTTNPRGVSLASFIEDERLELLNSGDVTHFHSPTGTFTYINLSLCSPNSFLDFSWRVLPDLHSSDHFPILIESADFEPRSRLPLWRLNKADWQRYTELTSSIRPLTDFTTCDEAAIYFADFFAICRLPICSQDMGPISQNPIPWWNEVCSNPVRMKRSAFNRFRRNRCDPQYLKAFRLACARARRILKKTQRSSWRSYLASITAKTPLTEIFNNVRNISDKFSAPPPPPVLLNAGKKVAEAETFANLFASHFANISPKDPGAPGARYRQNLKNVGVDCTSPSGECYNIPFSA